MELKKLYKFISIILLVLFYYFIMEILELYYYLFEIMRYKIEFVSFGRTDIEFLYSIFSLIYLFTIFYYRNIFGKYLEKYYEKILKWF